MEKSNPGATEQTISPGFLLATLSGLIDRYSAEGKSVSGNAGAQKAYFKLMLFNVVRLPDELV
ncbi:hypothetical protein J2782_003142 [Brucella pseudogrignonensis]|uniref:Uncharacterized protein n=1 Tax=Brucella pseudogrignonensis TaxID=419475 RepID=A0ABU1MCB0_9HYPH|nr:hypothetical protein [Brucella pseudogrignonensis]